MSLPPLFLDRLRDRVLLSALISHKIKLIRRGREFVGLCPFHHEKTPSFSVVDTKHLFWCFGCQQGGDQITWLEKIENLDFYQAVERLAEMAGLQMPQRTAQDKARYDRDLNLYEVLLGAQQWFARRLKPETAAWQYLQDRGIDEAAMQSFGLGWAPDERAALRKSFKAGDELLIEAGLIRKPREDAEPYDFFRGRVIFPIADRRGRVVGFTARTLGDAQPKYLNSADGTLFHKGSQLYGWNLALQQRDDRVAVVEGPIDVITAQQAGFRALAPLGTAVTEAQLHEIWRFGPEPILCFDGDAAGDGAAARALHRALPLLGSGRSLRFGRMPPGTDPDSLIRSEGAPAFARVLETAQPASQMLWRIEYQRQPANTPERRADLRHRLDAEVSQIADEPLRIEYKKFVGQQLAECGMNADSATFRLTSGTRPQQEALFRGLLLMSSLIPELYAELEALDLTAAPGLARLREALLAGGDGRAEAAAAGLHLPPLGAAAPVDRAAMLALSRRLLGTQT